MSKLVVYSHITVEFNGGSARRIRVPIQVHEKEFTKFEQNYEVKVGNKKVTSVEKKYIIWMAVTGKFSKVRGILDENQMPWNALVTKGVFNTWIYKKSDGYEPIAVVARSHQSQKGPNNVVKPKGPNNVVKPKGKLKPLLQKAIVKAVLPKSFHAVTYNLSFAASLHKPIGSEHQFVRDKCMAHSPFHCRANAIMSLLKMRNKAAVYAFQEYRPWDRRTLERLHADNGAHILRQTPNHNLVSDNSGNNVPVSQLFINDADVAAFIAVLQSSFYSAVMTCWDQKQLGSAVQQVCINVGRGNDLRPCHLLLTDKSLLIINIHAPQPQNYNVEELMQRINMAYYKLSSLLPQNIILMGDFNDTSKRMQHGVKLLNRQLGKPAMLMTCCYEPGYGMRGGKYQFTGDYIMSTLSTKRAFRVQPSGQYTSDQPTGNQVGRSDHEPIIVELVKT